MPVGIQTERKDWCWVITFLGGWGKLKNGNIWLNPSQNVDESQVFSLLIETPPAPNYIKFLSCVFINGIICHISQYAS